MENIISFRKITDIRSQSDQYHTLLRSDSNHIHQNLIATRTRSRIKKSLGGSVLIILVGLEVIVFYGKIRGGVRASFL